MIQVLDYSTTCGACSTPLTSPPRDGADSMCAYLHTASGRADFKETLGRARKRQKVVDSAPEVTASPEVVTEQTSGDPNAVTEDEAVTAEPWAVTLGTEDDSLPGETKQQRYRRLNKERVNARERDRRNGLST